MQVPLIAAICRCVSGVLPGSGYGRGCY